MRRVCALLAAVLLAVLLPAAPAPATDPAATLERLNVTVRADADGVLHAQLDLALDRGARDLTVILPTRLRVPDDPDAWQVLTYEALRLTSPAGEVLFESRTTADALVLTARDDGRGLPLSLRLDVRGASPPGGIRWRLPALTPVPRTVSATLRAPGTLTAVGCRSVAGAGHAPACRATNQSGAAALLESAGQSGDLEVTLAHEGQRNPSYVLVERLTPRTWLRRWWPAVALAAVALAGTVALLRWRPWRASPTSP